MNDVRLIEWWWAIPEVCDGGPGSAGVEPPFVIPAKAGIQASWERLCLARTFVHGRFSPGPSDPLRAGHKRSQGAAQAPPWGEIRLKTPRTDPKPGNSARASLPQVSRAIRPDAGACGDRSAFSR